MSQNYAQERIVEALKLAKGNTTRAVQTITLWAADDPRLLLALAKPHLGGIVAYNVNRVASGRAARAAAKAKPAPARSAQPQEGPFGRELLKAVANSSASIFGLEDTGRPRKAGQVSQNHVNAIHQIVSRSKK